jgi:hypothetical protein
MSAFTLIATIEGTSRHVSSLDLAGINGRDGHIQDYEPLICADDDAAIATLARGDDISGLTMNLHGREYKLINEVAFKAAASCPLVLRGTFGEAQFDREEFLRLALSFAELGGNA